MPDAASFDWSAQRVFLTGGGGFLGRAVLDGLRARGVPGEHVFAPRAREFNLAEQSGAEDAYAEAARRFADTNGPTLVLNLAAEVGGIGANRAHPGRFFFANMAICMHMIEHARRSGLQDREGVFVQIGSICAYPKHTPVPFTEDKLWDGYPEETNAPYGIAKKAAWSMLDAYHREYGLQGAYLLPINLYGPHDNFHPEHSHVVPALVRKCVEAMERGDEHIECWGTGSPTREFLYVADCAEAVLAGAERVRTPDPINLGTGQEVSIKQLVEHIAVLSGFATRDTLADKVRWDHSKPDGQPRRSVDTSFADKELGWRATTGIETGLATTIEWFKAHKDESDTRL